MPALREATKAILEGIARFLLGQKYQLMPRKEVQPITRPIRKPNVFSDDGKGNVKEH